MNLFKNCFIITIFGSSLAFGQFGQSGLLEYKVYSRGGNSSFASVDTSGMTEKERSFIKEKVDHGTSTDDQQSGLFEYEVYSKGGNSSFVSVDTSGMTADQKASVKENSLNGVPSDNKQSGLFEYKTTGLGGNQSLVGVDRSGFNESDKAKYLKTTHTAPVKENTDYLELEKDINSEFAKNE